MRESSHELGRIGCRKRERDIEEVALHVDVFCLVHRQYNRKHLALCSRDSGHAA